MGSCCSVRLEAIGRLKAARVGLDKGAEELVALLKKAVSWGATCCIHGPVLGLVPIGGPWSCFLARRHAPRFSANVEPIRVAQRHGGVGQAWRVDGRLISWL